GLAAAAVLATAFVAPPRLTGLAAFGLVMHSGAWVAARIVPFFMARHDTLGLVVAAVARPLVSVGAGGAGAPRGRAARAGGGRGQRRLTIIGGGAGFLGVSVWAVVLAPAATLILSVLCQGRRWEAAGATAWLAVAAACWWVCFWWGTKSDLRPSWLLELK